jgi:hypothetical protein
MPDDPSHTEALRRHASSQSETAYKQAQDWQLHADRVSSRGLLRTLVDRHHMDADDARTLIRGVRDRMTEASRALTATSQALAAVAESLDQMVDEVNESRRRDNLRPVAGVPTGT